MVRRFRLDMILAQAGREGEVPAAKIAEQQRLPSGKDCRAAKIAERHGMPSGMECRAPQEWRVVCRFRVDMILAQAGREGEVPGR